MPDKKSILLWAIAIFAISFFALHAHIHERGFTYINSGNQVLRHEARLAGQSPFFNPWQYRILTTWAVEALVTAYQKLGVRYPYYSAFTHFRFVQQLIIFALCFFYFRRFTQNHLLTLTGVILLGYAMSYGVWNSDLSFDTYMDIILYLLAFLSLEAGRFAWIIPISAVAAANRETAILIPVFAGVLAVKSLWPPRFDRREMTIACLAFAAFLIVSGAIQYHYGFAPPNKMVATDLGRLKLNLTDARTYFFVLGVVNVTLLLPIFFFGKLTPFLKRAFLAIVPIWFMAHYVMAHATESRLFLVPQAVVLIPILLHLIDAGDRGGVDRRRESVDEAI